MSLSEKEMEELTAIILEGETVEDLTLDELFTVVLLRLDRINGIDFVSKKKIWLLIRRLRGNPLLLKE